MNILFVTATRIGDVVLTTGVLAALVERHPSSRVTVACGALAAPLFATAPKVVRCIPVIKRKMAFHWITLWRRCCNTRWDLVVDFRGSGLAYLLPARQRRVYRRRPEAGHRVRELATVVDMDDPPSPRLWTTPVHEQAASRWVPSGERVLAVGPTANWRGKIWAPQNFAALVQRLTANGGMLAGARIAVLGAAEERELARPLLDAIAPDRLIDLVGRADLSTAGAVLRRCALFVGNDSGLMHLAAAAGTPTVGLFGPSRAEKYAPWGEHGAVARTAIPYDELFPADYDHRTTPSLMDSLSVDEVERVSVDLWRRCTSPSVDQ